MLETISLQSWGGGIPVEYSNPLTMAFVVFFFLLMIGIGVYASRFQSNEVDYFVAGRRAGLAVIALSAFAGLNSGWGIVGNAGVIFAAGFEFLVFVAFIPFFFVLSFWLLARKMRMLAYTKDVVTAPDAIYYRFEDERLRVLGAIAVFLGSIGYLAPQYAALGIIGAVVFPVGFYEALIIGLVVVGFYTVIGGMLAAIWSDAVQGAMMALGGVLSAFYMITQYPGGINEMMSTISGEMPEYFAFASLGMEGGAFQIGFIISFLIVFMTFAGQPHFITKFFMTRDMKALKWSPFIAAGAYLLAILLLIPAPFARAAVLQGQFESGMSPDAALPLALIEFAPPIVTAFILTAILAAIMSTSNAFLNIGAAAITHDILQENRGKELSNEQQVKYARIVTVIILIGAFLLSATFPDLIFVIGAAGWAIYASVFFPCVAIAYNWKGATAEGALWGGSIGLGLTLVLAYGSAYTGLEIPMGFLGGQVATVIGVLVFIVVSYITSTRDYYDSDKDIKRVLDTGRLDDEGKSPVATDGGEQENK